MKKFFLVLLLYTNLVFAQDDSIDIKFAPTLTEIGKTIGDKVSQPIDRDGGRIVSADKKMELIIPQDAVSKRTDISIQPVVNTLSPGGANAYQLEPSGISFQKPLKIIFHYSSKEDVAMPELRNIAWQDDKGQWHRLDSCITDTTTRTVSGNISHFSRWMWFDAFSLKPITARLKVGHKLNLYIWCTGFWDNAAVEERIPPKIKFSSYVNSIRGGNAVVGTVTPVKDMGGLQMLDYTAPANVPDNNPVAVSVETNAVFALNGTKFKKLKLVSNITIYDQAYEIKVSGWNQQRAGKCMLASVDSSTCLLMLNGSRTKLEDIQNMDVKIVIDKKCECNIQIWSSGYDVGPVNIEGASKIQIIPAAPPKNRIINVWFIRTAGVVPGMRSDPCGPGHVPVSVPPFTLPALPFFLSWEDDGKEHLVKDGNDINGWECRVTPAKDKEGN